MSTELSAGWVWLTAFTWTVAACSDATKKPQDQTEPQVAEVLFIDSISDEALGSMLDADWVDDARRHVSFETPAPESVLERDSPGVFSWQVPSTARVEPHQKDWVGKLWGHLAPVRVAHAHGPVYNGTAYYLVFRNVRREPLLGVFTAGTRFVVSAQHWAEFSRTGGSITATLGWAVFENSLVVSEGGPFVGASVRFTIQ